MEQEDDADQRDDETFLDQRVLERVDGGVDQVRPVFIFTLSGRSTPPRLSIHHKY